MIQIIPAIDVIGGKCVRLTKGEYSSKKIYDSSPLDMALSYQDCGVRRIHMVDLDGARLSSPSNLHTLEAVASRVSLEIEWGGGIATSADMTSVFNAGATQAIAGSVAVRNPDLMHGWIASYGAEKMILGADVRNGKVAVKGWLEDSETGIDELVESFLPDGLNQVICTDISRDGMLQGPSFQMYRDLQDKFTSVIFTVSGGISSMEDIEKLDGFSLPRVIVGKAIYEGLITLKQIEQWQLQNE